MNFLSLSIRARLIITSIILVLLFVGGMGYSWFSLQTIDSSMEEVTEEFLPLASTIVDQLSKEIEQQDMVAHTLDSYRHIDDEGRAEEGHDDHAEEGHDDHAAGTPAEEAEAALAFFAANTLVLQGLDETVEALIEGAHDATEAAQFEEIDGDVEELLELRVSYLAALDALLSAAPEANFEQREEALIDALDSVRDSHNTVLDEMATEALAYTVSETTTVEQLGHSTAIYLTYIALVIIVLVILLSLSSVLSVSRPVGTITDALGKLRAGDLDARTGYKGGDELQTLGFTLDNMLDERDAKIQADLEDSRQLNSSVMDVLRSVSVLGKGDLTTEVPMAEDITGALGDAINQMTENMIETLELVTQSSTNVLNASGEVNAMAQSGKDAVVKNTEAMNEIRNTIQETAKRIKRLGERSQDINGIVKVINDISERTSVLALNANMQAAAAGEAGRGFMVVANEVQRLAESSQEATKQIGKLVDTIQTETGDTIVAMDKGIEEVVKGAELAEEAATQMDKTVATLDGLNRVGEQLKASVSAFKLPTSA